jgi:hypothetical protein
MCGDGKQAFRDVSDDDDEVVPRTKEQIESRKLLHVRETEPMSFIRDTMR